MNKLNGWCVKSALIFIQIIWAQRKQPYWPLIEASSRIPQQSLLVSKSICTPLTAAAESQVQRDGINLQSKGRTFTLICDTILVWDQMQDLCFQRGPLCLSRHSFSHGWAKTATGLGWCCIPLDNAEARQRYTFHRQCGNKATVTEWQPPAGYGLPLRNMDDADSSLWKHPGDGALPGPLERSVV